MRVLNLLYLVLFSTVGLAAELPGRFTGVLHHESLGKDQLAKLELIPTRGESNSLEYMAILTLHLGGFTSKEYVAYHFQKVTHNPARDTFVFSQPDQAITVQGARITKQGRFEATVRSLYSSSPANLILDKTEEVVPESPLIEPIWGQYEGQCDGKRNVLQLYTYRSSEDTGHQGQAFASYSIRGHLAWPMPELETGSPEQPLLQAVFVGGSYNFFEGELALFGVLRNLTCQVNGEKITCDGCEYYRKSNEMRSLQLAPPRAKSILSAHTESPVLTEAHLVSLQGEYTGYLHHEYLDEYQPAQLNIVTYQSDAQKLLLSAQATLQFGEQTKAEKITYRFMDRSFPNPLDRKNFVFEDSEHDVDAILKITKLGDGEILGEWYSHLFGRVGTFVLRKGGVAELPKEATVFGALGGNYENDSWELSVRVRPSTRPLNSLNPFYPNVFGGLLAHKDGLIAGVQIIEGSYDFYTGRFGLLMEGLSGKQRLWVGDKRSAKQLAIRELNLFKRSLTFVMGRHEQSNFRLVDEDE